MHCSFKDVVQSFAQNLQPLVASIEIIPQFTKLVQFKPSVLKS